MGKILRNNGLSIVLVAFFVIFLIGQAIAGYHESNEDERFHGRTAQGFGEYLASSHFLESVFENWESEFLQMAAYVVFTVFLFQKGSAESKDPEHEEKVDEDVSLHRNDPNAPKSLRAGGWRLRLYSHSLSIALTLLFLGSWLGHALSGRLHYNDERLEHGREAVSLTEYLASSRFWFESFQNWQSEFLAVAAIVVLSIWLRERGSPESKPVWCPHDQTGE